VDARGVRQVLDILTASRKAVIAHHSLLDLLHVYDAFVGDIAGMSFAQFKQRLPRHLPLLFDTKVSNLRVKKIFFMCFFSFDVLMVSGSSEEFCSNFAISFLVCPSSSIYSVFDESNSSQDDHRPRARSAQGWI
jgi:hypothetical protein